MYETAIAKIPQVGYAQLNDCYVVDTPNTFYNIFKPITQLSHTFDVPVTMIILNQPGEPTIEQAKGLGFTEFPGRKNCFVGTPSVENLAAVHRLPLINAQPSPGYISVDGLLGWSYAMKGIQIFSSISRAASFEGLPNILEDGDYDTLADGSVKMYPLGSVISTEVSGFDKKAAKYLYHGSVKHILVGYDSSMSLKGHYTSVAQPNLSVKDGLYFPYFDGMVLPDKAVFNHVFPTIFYHCLGENAEVAAKLWSRIRSGYRSMAWTPAGRIISHAYYGIDLAKKTLGSFTPVFEGQRYMGFVIQADQLTIKIHGRTYTARGIMDLQEDIKVTTKHDAALAKIVTLINAPIVDGKHVYSVKVDQINTSYKLKGIVINLDLGHFQSTPFVEEMLKLESELSFTEQYPVPTAKVLQQAISYMQTGDYSTIASYPQFLGNSLLFDKERIVIALGIFGPRVPSLNFGNVRNSLVFSMPVALDAADPNLVVAGGKRRLQYLPFSIVPIREGIVQWRKMFESGDIHIPHPRKNKAEFTNTQLVQSKISGEPMFSQVYQVLRQISSETRKARQLGKRSREDDTERGGASKRSKRADKDVDEAL